LTTPKQAFDESMKRAQSFLVAYRELHGKRGRVPKARADLLRGVVVFAVAAMDAYVRDTVASNLAKLVASRAKANRDLPEELVKVVDSAMNTKALIKAAYASRPGSHIRSAVEGILAERSFQSARAIEDAFKIIGLDDLTAKVAEECSDSKKQLERKIREIAKRRHQIVHQADLHQDKQHKRKPREIKVGFVEDALKTIDSFVKHMDQVVKKYMQGIK